MTATKSDRRHTVEASLAALAVIAFFILAGLVVWRVAVASDVDVPPPPTRGVHQ